MYKYVFSAMSTASPISGRQLSEVVMLPELKGQFTLQKKLGQDPLINTRFKRRTFAGSNANQKNLLFSFICIRVGTFKVRRLKRA